MILSINLGKLILIQIKYKASPYNSKTILTVLLIGIIYVSIINLKDLMIFDNIVDYSPIYKITLRSLLITIVYVFLSYLFGLTKDFQEAILQFRKKT